MRKLVLFLFSPGPALVSISLTTCRERDCGNSACSEVMEFSKKPAAHSPVAMTLGVSKVLIFSKVLLKRKEKLK